MSKPRNWKDGRREKEQWLLTDKLEKTSIEESPWDRTRVAVGGKEKGINNVS